MSTGLIYRPPFEARSFLLKVTAGCSHNCCSFCTMYRDVPFSVIPVEQVENDLREAAETNPGITRVFLENGDPFCLSADRLAAVAEMIHAYLPKVETITMYASILNIKEESIEKKEKNMKEKSINPFPEVSTEGLKDQPHGPLISFSYNLSSNGMMAGSGSYGGDELSWNKDGSITLTSKYNGGGKSVRTEYRVKPEPAAKMRDYVAEKHLAALAEKEIPTPMVYDNFTSSSFSMTFDDSALGGIPYKKCTVNCGPAGMTFRSIEEKLRAILKECRETGELIYTHEKEAGGAFAGFPGFAGMTTGTPASGSQPGPVPAKPAEPQPGCWTCTKCGFTGNRGRFCSECGSSR